jgi:uncharacterized protein
VRIFLDANILFSAARSAGAMRTLIEMLRKSRHDLVASPSVLIEARRNLERKTSLEALDTLVRLQTNVEISDREVDGQRHSALTVWLPEKDRHVLAAAIERKCDALITGDKTHFGEGYGKSFGGVLIVSPRMAAERFL